MKSIILVLLYLFSYSLFAKTFNYRLVGYGNMGQSMRFVLNADVRKASDITVQIFDKEHTDQISQARLLGSFDYKGLNHYQFQFDNLTAGHSYGIIINSPGYSVRHLWFRVPVAREKLSLVVGGDSRNNRGVRVLANKMVAKLRPDIVLFGGDLTGSSSNTQLKNWLEDWQNTISSDGRMAPLVIARGNHERSNLDIARLFAVDDTAYYTSSLDDYLTIWTLNSEVSMHSRSSQTLWFAQSLEVHKNSRWKIAQYHRPMRPHTKRKSEGVNQHKYWGPLFHKYGVNLVSESDSHTMKTTFPISPSTESSSDEGWIRDDNKGTVFVGEGCWGAPLRPNDDAKEWTHSTGRFNGFHWIFMTADKMEIRAVNVYNANSVDEKPFKEDRFFLSPELKFLESKVNGNTLVIYNNQSEEILLASPESGENVIPGEQVKFSFANNHLIAQVTLKNKSNGEVIYQQQNGNDFYFSPQRGVDNQWIVEAIDQQGVVKTFETSVVVTLTKTYQIKNSIDDFEQKKAGSLYTNSSDLELTLDGPYSQKVGLVFRGVEIAQNAVLSNAYLQFTTDETDSVETNLNIFTTLLPADFSTAKDYSSFFDAFFESPQQGVAWAPRAWNERGVLHNSSSLTSQIQKIISGKEGIHDLGVMITGKGKRVAVSYDKSPAQSVKLIMEWK